MKWARVQSDDETVFVGVIVNDTFEPRADLGSDHVTGPIMDMNTLKLLPPIEPGKFIGLWNNFKAAAEKGGMQHPDHPLYFLWQIPRCQDQMLKFVSHKAQDALCLKVNLEL